MGSLFYRLLIAQVIGCLPGAVLVASTGRHAPNLGAPMVAMAGFCLASFLVGFREAHRTNTAEPGHLRGPAWQAAVASILVYVLIVMVLPASSVPLFAVMWSSLLCIPIGIGAALAFVQLGYECGDGAAPPW